MKHIWYIPCKFRVSSPSVTQPSPLGTQYVMGKYQKGTHEVQVMYRVLATHQIHTP